MDWDALANFVVKIGVPAALLISVPFLAWKWMDMKSKRNG